MAGKEIANPLSLGLDSNTTKPEQKSSIEVAESIIRRRFV